MFRLGFLRPAEQTGVACGTTTVSTLTQHYGQLNWYHFMQANCLFALLIFRLRIFKGLIDVLCDRRMCVSPGKNIFVQSIRILAAVPTWCRHTYEIMACRNRCSKFHIGGIPILEQPSLVRVQLALSVCLDSS